MIFQFARQFTQTALQYIWILFDHKIPGESRLCVSLY